MPKRLDFYQLQDFFAGRCYVKVLKQVQHDISLLLVTLNLFQGLTQ